MDIRTYIHTSIHTWRTYHTTQSYPPEYFHIFYIYITNSSSQAQVADGVEFYVAAASSVVQEESTLAGDWQVLLSAGVQPLPAGCGPCIGLGAGLLKEGEVGISATNRNFKGRMGHPDAQVYLASPATVTASALAGYITSAAHDKNSSSTDLSSTEAPVPHIHTPMASSVMKEMEKKEEEEAKTAESEALLQG